jgi:hypothetical protein
MPNSNNAEVHFINEDGTRTIIPVVSITVNIDNGFSGSFEGLNPYGSITRVEYERELSWRERMNENVTNNIS